MERLSSLWTSEWSRASIEDVGGTWKGFGMWERIGGADWGVLGGMDISGTCKGGGDGDLAWGIEMEGSI